VKFYQKTIPAILVTTAIIPNVYADSIANPDSATMNQGESSVEIPVLDNDTSTNIEYTGLYISEYDNISSQGGTISAAASPNALIYSPPSDSFTGTDTFTYMAFDEPDYGSSIATVTVTVVATSTQSPASVVLTAKEQRVATALDDVCKSGSAKGALIDVCNATGAERSTAIQQLIPTQLSSQGSYSVELQHNQFMNITSRLALLRAGITGASTDGLSLKFDRQPSLTKALASLQSAMRGGGASADEPQSTGRLGFFINGSGSFGDRDSTVSELGFDFSTKGISTGIDYRISDELVFGGALGYVSTGMDFENTRGDQDIKGYSLSAYGSWYQSENLYIDGILSYGTNNFDMTRQIKFGTTDVSTQGDTDGTEYALSIGGAYEINQGALNLGPFARINYINAEIDAFQEYSTSGVELGYDKQNVESLATMIGVQASYAVSTKFGVVMPYTRLEWAHEFKYDSHNITAHFLNDPASGRFSIGTDDPDRNFFNLGLGVSAVFTQGRTGFVYYEKVLGRDNLNNNSMVAGIRFEF
jgi:outer membrane lipase/esterase